jgi:large subunit ribosomal protein L18
MKKKKIVGTAERPRLSTYRALKNITAQLIDDTAGRTLAAASTVEKGLAKNGGNITAARAIGKLIAQRGLAKGIKKVVFDRGKSLYHGRVKALAEAAREGGLEF